MPMTLQEAILKATKLLRLSESNNPHEAALAAQRAQEILDQYEISKSMLEENGDATEPDEDIIDFGHKDAPLEEPKGQVQQWKSQLAVTIAEVNACRIYVTTGWKIKKLQIIGRPSDVEKVRYLFMLLVQEVDRLCERDGRGCGRTWRNNYRIGVISTIRDKLSDGRKATFERMRSGAKNKHALVRVDKAIMKLEKKKDDVDQYIKNRKNFKKGTSSNSRFDFSARLQGQKAGKEISISGARGALGSGTKSLKSGK